MFRRLAHVKEEGSPLGVDHGYPNFLELRQRVVRRTRVRRSSQNKPSETVRKGVRVALRLQIWCVYSGRNRSKRAFGRPVGLPAGPSGTFRTVSPRTPVNKGKRKDRGCAQARGAVAIEMVLPSGSLK